MKAKTVKVGDIFIDGDNELGYVDEDGYVYYISTSVYENFPLSFINDSYDEFEILKEGYRA